MTSYKKHAVIDAETLAEMRRLSESGMKQAAIGNRFKVTASTVCRLLAGHKTQVSKRDGYLIHLPHAGEREGAAGPLRACSSVTWAAVWGGVVPDYAQNPRL